MNPVKPYLTPARERTDPSVVSINQMNYVQFLKGIKDESVDCVWTDPPYESMEKYRKVGTTTRLKGDGRWFPVISDEELPELMKELYRILKRNRHCYVMCNHDTELVMRLAGEAAGFKFWKRITWDKLAIGMGYHYRNRVEFILFFEKGKRRLKYNNVPDLLTAKRLISTRKMRHYPTKKPQVISSDTVGNSTYEGEIVVDPFAGGGEIINTCIDWGLDIITNDISTQAITEMTRITESRNIAPIYELPTQVKGVADEVVPKTMEKSKVHRAASKVPSTPSVP